MQSRGLHVFMLKSLKNQKIFLAASRGQKVVPDDLWLMRASCGNAAWFREGNLAELADPDSAEPRHGLLRADLGRRGNRPFHTRGIGRIGRQAKGVAAIGRPFEQDEPVEVASRRAD